MNDLKDAYFRPIDSQADLDPAFPPVFTTLSELPVVTLSEGVRAQPVFGKGLLLSFVRFEPNTVAPLHQHIEEQMGTVLEGEMEFELNGVKRLMRPGDVYVAPPNVPHGARSYAAGCLALDVFSPPRGGYRELLERTLAAQTADQQRPG